MIIQDVKPKRVGVTCAVAIFTPSKKILIVHPTGAGFIGAWSLPKGLRDPGETVKQAAIREVREETSLVLTGELYDHGPFPYTNEKNYHLFSTKLKDEINVKRLKCETTFERNGRQVVEVDKFMLVGFLDAVKFLNKKQSDIFTNVIFKELA